MIAFSKTFQRSVRMQHLTKLFRFFPIQQIIEVSTSPVSGIIFSQLRATVTGSVKCLPDSGSNCADISVTLNALDTSGKHDGKQSIALLKSKLTTTLVTFNWFK